MRDRTDSKQNPYIAGSRPAVENNRLVSTGSNLPQDPAFTGIFYMAEREGFEPSMGFWPAGRLLEISNLLIHNGSPSPAIPSFPHRWQ